MSATQLKPGDRVCFQSEKGLKLRGVVADGLMLKTRGEPLMIPVVRPRSGRPGKVGADGHHVTGLRIHWILRNQLRKLPAKRPTKLNRVADEIMAAQYI